jgi:hypothetical protein
LIFALVAALSARAQEQKAPPPLPLVTKAHAHNDYQHTRPLLDALDNGFCSVEADIFLTNGQLLVAHAIEQTKPERTLQSLYLDPLQARVKQNNGHVYTNGGEFTLLIELKQEWPGEYPALLSVLTNYAPILVNYTTDPSAPGQSQTPAIPEQKHTNAILVIITGHRDPNMFKGETIRYAAADGGMGDLDKNPPANLVPWISENWKAFFKWNGKGAIPDAELDKLKKIVQRAHDQGRRVRFWNAPDTANFWQVMHVVGVDLINTDNLPGVARFFQGK